YMHAVCTLSSSYSDHRPLHSFPTRRSSDLIHAWIHIDGAGLIQQQGARRGGTYPLLDRATQERTAMIGVIVRKDAVLGQYAGIRDRKSTRLNSSHDQISYAVFCLKKKKKD